MGCPCDKTLQVAGYWGVAGCSPGQSSLAAVPAGFCHIYAFVIFVGLTPCAPNGLPHRGIQVQSQKSQSLCCTVGIGKEQDVRRLLVSRHIRPTTSVLSADNPTLFLAPASRTLNMMSGDIVALPVRCQDKSATSLTSLASAVPGFVALECRSHTHSLTHPHDCATLPKNR